MAANFARARAGRTCRQVLLPVLLAVVCALMAANAVARMVFAALGETPAHSTWLSVVMLHLFSGVAGMGAASRMLPGLNSRMGQVGMSLSGLCSGALTGFFYVGSYGGYDMQAAIAGAMVGAGLIAILGMITKRARAIVILAMGAIAAYGFAFLIWAIAATCLHTGRYGWGICLGALSLIYVWFVIVSLRAASYEMSQLGGTSFRGANVTHARFDQAVLQHTDFSHVIGQPAIL